MAESDIGEQISWRYRHSTEMLGDDLVLWGGKQSGLPEQHDGEEKLFFTANLDTFSLSTMEWSNDPTTGTPPGGVMNYATTTIGEEMYLFGGKYDFAGSGCYNDLYKLNTTNKEWIPIPTTGGPMKKSSCGFISYSYEGSDYLLTLGGVGGQQPPPRPQPNSQYIPCFGNYYTNEIHVMNLTASPGKWRSPTVTGDRPPPIGNFSLHVLPNDRSKAVLFVGEVLTQDDNIQYGNDIYILSLTNDTVNFSKLNSPQQSPKPRFAHASTIITSGTEDHLLIIGGYDGMDTYADSWAFNISTKQWNRVMIARDVCERQLHSVSSVAVNSTTQWILVSGGKGGVSVDFFPIEGDNVVMIVELEYSNGEWLVRGVWNTTQKQQLVERMKTIKK